MNARDRLEAKIRGAESLGTERVMVDLADLKELLDANPLWLPGELEGTWQG